MVLAVTAAVFWFAPLVASATPAPGAKPKPTTTAAPAPTTTNVAPTTSTTVGPTTTTFPAGLLAIANSVRRSAPNNTAALLAALAPLQKMGYNALQADIVGMGQFPVAGPAYYADDWLEPRFGPVPRLHQGNDIVAAFGTPLRSPADGTLKYDTSDPTGYGLAAVVTTSDKTFYVLAHMSATVAGLATGSAVKQGQVIGFVGATGDATGPHCHFEVHPLGGAAVDPKPYLDGWLKAAMVAVPALIKSIRGVPATTTLATVPVIPVATAVWPATFPASVPAVATRSSRVPASAPFGLALVALLALVATAGAAVVRYR